MFKKVIEGIVQGDWPPNSSKYQTEDNGRALIATLYMSSGETVSQETDPGIFVRIQSWDEAKEHKEARQIEGKRVRITIEEV